MGTCGGSCSRSRYYRLQSFVIVPALRYSFLKFSIRFFPLYESVRSIPLEYLLSAHLIAPTTGHISPMLCSQAQQATPGQGCDGSRVQPTHRSAQVLRHCGYFPVVQEHSEGRRSNDCSSGSSSSIRSSPSGVRRNNDTRRGPRAFLHTHKHRWLEY